MGWCYLTSNKQSGREQDTCHWDNDAVVVVPDQHAYLDLDILLGIWKNSPREDSNPIRFCYYS